MSDIIPEGILYGNLGVGSGTTNYNDLDNKPQINSVTLQGNKTASELGLVGTSDIPVTSVNGETGAVVLDGTEIEFSTGVSINEKILAVEQEIPVIAYPVTSVNSKTGAVVLDGTDINYQAGVTINQKIDAVESEIPVVSYPVTSVNGETGAVVLDGTDIEYSSGVSVNSQIDTLMNYIPVYGNTASGAIATFDTSLALPLQDCTITISGSGATGANITRCGKNLVFTKITGAGIDASGTIIANATYDMFVAYIRNGVTYTGKSNTTPLVGGYYSSIPSVGSISIDGTRFTTLPATFTAAQDCFIAFRGTTGFNGQLEVGSSSTDYESYNGTTYPITWQSVAGTVTDGSLDVTTGKLTVVNGSMGAGDYQITPIPINQLSGTNNIFCDTGNTSVVYACSLKDYIDGQ